MTEVGHNYWMRKGRYTPSQRNNIEWHAQYKAMKPINSTRQRTLSKWFSGWLGTGKNMRRWKLRYASNCPFCGHLDEDTNHVLKCSHPKVTTNWTSLLKAYDIKLAKGKTCYALRKAIILELRAWRNMDTAPSLSFADPQLKQAIQAQREVGWRCFLEGLMVKDIITYQTEYLASNYSLHNSTSWTKKIYRLGWNLIMDMWSHRNENLHESETIDFLNGKEVLEETIRKELQVGLSELPTLEFTHLFRFEENKLMQKSLDGKKDWLTTVKLGRKLHNDKNYIEDEFDTNKALQDWVGLGKEEICEQHKF